MSMDRIGQNKEQQNSELQGEKRKSGYSNSNSGSSSQIDRINARLAKPNITDSERRALLQEKQKIEGTSTGSRMPDTDGFYEGGSGGYSEGGGGSGNYET